VTVRSGHLRGLSLSVIPHGIVEAERNRRMLSRLGSATFARGSAQLARDARLDLLPPGSLKALHTVVDVGANVGKWSTAVAKLARPTRLIAVEPSPHVLPALREALRGVSGASVVPEAVGDTIGETTFNVTGHSHSASILPPRVEEMNPLYGGGSELIEQVSVPLTTLDEITGALEHISLLKIDVQGYERAVLKGGSKTLSRTTWLLIEGNFRSHYEGDLLFPELHALLVISGFLLTGMSAPFIRGGEALWIDALYMRPAG
jgi:FkbM family methyltransferase